jgi:protein tyrosine kinase modulator
VDTRSQVKQYVDIAWRRKWWVLVPTILGTAASIYLYTVLPKLYRATTTILVTRQRIPDDIVRSTVTSTIGETIKTLKVQVLSRTYLERVAEEIGLIQANADEMMKERACNQIENSVDLDWDKRDGSWFSINVHDKDPQRAARVANRLAEMFIEQNANLRVKQASGAVNLLDGWVKQTEEELSKRDEEISRFRREHLYELPDQQDATLQLLNGAQNRVSQLTSEIQIKTDRLSIMTSEFKANRAAAAAAGISVPGDDADSRALAQLENELGDLLVSYTDENPLVRKKRDQIAQFKASHPALGAPKQTGTADSDVSPEARRLEMELRTLQSDRDREQGRVHELTSRLGNIPLRAQKLADLTRDYDTLKKDYDTKVGQREMARRSQEVEEAKKGDQFQIQDAARPPAVPYQPVLMQLLLMGILAGAGVGVGITALLEFLDQSVRSEEQFADIFPDVAILGSIPNLVTGGPVKPRVDKSGSGKKAAAS